MTDEHKPARRKGRGPGHGGPARGYSWPPFEPGNRVSLKHGARSARLPELVADRTDELVEQLYREHPHLSQADHLAVRAVAMAEAVVERLAAYIAEHGAVTPEGKPAHVLTELRSWMARAEAARARVGADPRSRRDLAIDELRVRELAREDIEEGRRLRLAREARERGDGT